MASYGVWRNGEGEGHGGRWGGLTKDPRIGSYVCSIEESVQSKTRCKTQQKYPLKVSPLDYGIIRKRRIRTR